MKKIRIAILGIGGVGGYFGGLLANKYSDSDEIEIIFIARGKSQEVIRKKGLKLITNKDEKIIVPHLVSNDPDEIGKLDLLICTTKGYDLENSLIPYKNCIDQDTYILPLLNGIDASDKIRKVFPKANILEGCVYIIARLIEPGVVKATGGHSFHFGSTSAISKDKLEKFQKIFTDADINSHLHDDIEKKIWEKYIFISCLASLTSYLDLPIGAIMQDPKHKQTMVDLLKEVKAIADAKKIIFQDRIIPDLIAHMEALDFEATSSMHSDFKKGGKTEYESLTEYVVKLGGSLGVSTPEFDKILVGLKEKMKTD